MKRLTLCLLILAGLASAQLGPLKITIDSGWCKRWAGTSTLTPRAEGDAWMLAPWWGIKAQIDSIVLTGKAADAFGADSADVGVVSRSCTGQAATVATIAGLTADTAVAAGRASDLVGAAADSIKFWAGDGTMRLRSSWNMPQTLTDGATINWSLALGGCAKVTLGGNRTLANPTNIVNGTKVQLFIVQDSTGSRTLTWGSHYKFCGGTTAPTLTATGWPTPGGDLFEFVCYSDTLLYFANFCPAIWP